MYCFPVAVRLYYKNATDITIKKRTQKWLQNRSDEYKRRLSNAENNREKVANSANEPSSATSSSMDGMDEPSSPPSRESSTTDSVSQ